MEIYCPLDRITASEYNNLLLRLQEYKVVILFEAFAFEDYVSPLFHSIFELGALPGKRASAHTSAYYGAPNVASFLPGKSSIIDLRALGMSLELLT